MANESGLRRGGLRSRLSGRLPDRAPTDPSERDRVSRRGAEFSEATKTGISQKDYHRGTCLSPQPASSAPLRLCASARWSSAVNGYGLAVMIDADSFAVMTDG